MGLAAFLVLVTFPVWSSVGPRTRLKGPNLALPAHEKDCVMPARLMMTSHMKLLLQWRKEVVRDDLHSFKAYDGKLYKMKLTGTCLGCHNKAKFCDRCHTYMGVETPYCWNCHIDPALARRSQQ
jgi:[DsrC]-trisulfide reductase subunit J